MRSWLVWSGLLACMGLAIVAGCGGDKVGTGGPDATGDGSAATDEAGAVTRTTEDGPVKAVVSVTPASAPLGDPLVLTLTVTAEPGVTVEMPAFGEALGRFTIADFTPRESVTADGGTIQSQRYTLQAPMSGRQRIPPLRLEFVDERPGQPGAAGGAPARELLTEEIQIEIASVLPDGVPITDLRPARGRLAALREPVSPLWWVLGLLIAGAVGYAGWYYGRLYLAERRRVTAYDRAMTRLAVLAARGMPGAEGADAWYVELSAIVRRYLEDRFAVRAPELTTEEFLQEAKRLAELSADHRARLSAFLEACDQVKFAGYRPEPTESREALELARRFVEETRLKPDEEKRREKIKRAEATRREQAQPAAAGSSPAGSTRETTS